MMKRTFSVIAFFCTTASALFAENPAVPASEPEQTDDLVRPGDVFPPSDGSLSGKIFTPARAAVGIRQHLITPFYVSYSQSLPTAISTGGKIASSTYGGGASWRYVAEDKTRISLTNFDYLRTDFRFSGGSGSAPFSHTDTLHGSTYQEFINPKNGRALVGLFSGSVSADDSTDLSNGVGCIIGIAGKQYFSEEISATLGLGSSYQCARERWYFFPMVLFNWRITESLNLRTTNGVTLTWDVGGNDVLLIDFSLEYETFAFASATDDDRGVYYRKRVPLTVSGTWNISENIFVGAGIMFDVWTKYRFYRGGHKTNEDFSTDPTFELTLQAGFRF